MLRVALAGGIGSGKSTVAKLFAGLGAPVIDTDVLARELVEPGQPALREIVRQMGPAILNPDGTLDRTAVRKKVFADPASRTALEQILHPRIFQAIEERISGLADPYVILVIPLLVESGQTDVADRVLVVDVPEKMQREITMKRDKISPDFVSQILASQCRRAQRLAMADDVIDNSGPPDQLREIVEALHRSYLRLAAETGRPSGEAGP